MMKSFLTLLALSAAILGGPSRANEDSVLEAVFVVKLRELREAARSTTYEPKVFCLAIDPGHAPQTPGRDFMARFKEQADVRPAGHCEGRGARVVEIGTGARAAVLTAGPVEWVSAGEAWVKLSVWRDRRQFTATYRVVLERDRWIALGPIYKVAPA